MKEETRKEVTRLIALNEITDPTDERIETCITDRFPDEYSNDQEYVAFQAEIGEIVTEENRGTLMEKTTAKKLKAEFESHHNHTYKTDREFITAAEHTYNIDENENGEMVFSGGDTDFIVTDWIEFDGSN